MIFYQLHIWLVHFISFSFAQIIWSTGAENTIWFMLFGTNLRCEYKIFKHSLLTNKEFYILLLSNNCHALKTSFILFLKFLNAFHRKIYFTLWIPCLFYPKSCFCNQILFYKQKMRFRILNKDKVVHNNVKIVIWSEEGLNSLFWKSRNLSNIKVILCHLQWPLR